jgi:hypothetical protein
MTKEAADAIEVTFNKDFLFDRHRRAQWVAQ